MAAGLGRAAFDFSTQTGPKPEWQARGIAVVWLTYRWGKCAYAATRREDIHNTVLWEGGRERQEAWDSYHEPKGTGRAILTAFLVNLDWFIWELWGTSFPRDHSSGASGALAPPVCLRASPRCSRLRGATRVGRYMPVGT